jgi:hypothetical protein
MEKSRARLRTADGVVPANSTGSGELHGDEQQTPATNDTSDERGALEKEASSGRKEWERVLLHFIGSRREEEASTREMEKRISCIMAPLMEGDFMGE